MENLEKQVKDLENDVDHLVELLGTFPTLQELFKVIPGHLQAARRVESDANAAMARRGLDGKSLESFRDDIDVLVLNLGYAQGTIVGKNAEVRARAEKAALVESGVCQSMAVRVRDLAYRLIHAEGLAARAKNARRVIEDVSDAAYRLLRQGELEARYERYER